MGIIVKLGKVLSALLVVSMPLYAQFIEYQEIRDPALRATKASMRAHQIQYTMYMFYSLNIDTPGFVETGGYNRRMKDTGQIKMQPYYRWRAGPLVETDRDLDFIIDADNRGFFMVQLPGGVRGYTRDGRFSLDSQGRLVMVDGGYPVLGTGGYIYIPENADISCSKSGVLFVGGDAIDQLEIQVLTNAGRDRLITVNGSVFVSSEQGPPDSIVGEEHYAVRQGYLEQNNVMKAIVGDVTMLKRAYEGISKAAKVTSRAMGMAVQMGAP